MDATLTSLSAEAGRFGVLLLGGCSGTGKSTLAAQLGRRFGVSWCQVDDVRLALQQVTAPETHPALHYFVRVPGEALPAIWRRDPAELCAGLIGVGEVVCQALEVIVSHHLATASPIILEGDGIMPAFVARWLAEGQRMRLPIRGVLLDEADQGNLREAMLMRSRGMQGWNEADVQAQVEMYWRYARWLATEANRHGVAVIAARPFASQFDRIVEALDLPR